jgi:ArsR family metal-binding transcriptional regulator
LTEKVLLCERNAAILDPAVFWQFGNRVSPEEVIQAFYEIGFAMVWNMGESLAMYETQVTAYLASAARPLPAISSACPAVVEFIRVKYPSLMENLVPILPPPELLMSQIREDGESSQGLKRIYVTPCLAQAEAFRVLLGEENALKAGEGSLPIEKIYNQVETVLHRRKVGMEIPQVSNDLFKRMKWASPGGGSEALHISPPFIAAGLERLANVLERIEAGLLEDVPFIEAWACLDGCLGGPFTVQNPCVANYHLSFWMGKMDRIKRGDEDIEIPPERIPLRIRQPLKARPGLRLDANVKVAMEKLHRIDAVKRKFPGIDCGSCGCPTCLALAEDIVQGLAEEADCHFLSPKKRGKKRTS